MKRLILVIASLAAALSCQKQVPIATGNKDEAPSEITPGTGEVQSGNQIADDTWYIAESKSFIGVRYPTGGCAYQKLLPDEATISWKMTSAGVADITIAYRFPPYHTSWPEPDKHFSLVLHDVSLTLEDGGSITVNQGATEAAFYTQELSVPITVSKVSGVLMGSHSQFVVEGEMPTHYGPSHEFILRMGKLTQNRADAGFGKLKQNDVDFITIILAKVNNQTPQNATVTYESILPISDNRLGDGPFEIPAGESCCVYLGNRFLWDRTKGLRIRFEDGTERYYEKEPYCFDFIGLPDPEISKVFDLSVVDNHWDRSYYDVFEYTLTPGT